MIVRKRNLKKVLIILMCITFVIIIGAGIFLVDYFNLIPKKSYTATDFRIETIKSTIDFNANGVDDYTDILLGAKKTPRTSQNMMVPTMTPDILPKTLESAPM